MPTASQAVAVASAGTNSPRTQHEAHHAGAASCEPLLRVGRYLQAVAAAREVSDAEIRQHAMDSAHLMEAAYERFQASGDPADREEAVLWMHHRDEAMRSLSPAWKAAREAQIQQAINESAGHFIEMGDAARARMQGRHA